MPSSGRGPACVVFSMMLCCAALFVSTCDTPTDTVGQAMVAGVIRNPAGPVAGARVQMTQVEAPAETEAGSVGGVLSAADGTYTLRFFSSFADSADVLGVMAVMPPLNSGLRDTVISNIPIRIRKPAGSTVQDVTLTP